ncbi:hypothetical protein AX769_00110 [Frondihabitans sp. PAMC 28766]|nr:hypothetical protein AX769_00110 [Frondihabitans sp. PAMC 28766]
MAFAERGRLDDVTVSELARAAEVTRDTFYRHATSVTDLLTLAIRELLEEFGAAYSAELPPRSELATVLRESEPALLHHIAEHANVYRTALSGPNASPVYRTLVDFLARSLELALREYPDIAPLPPDELDGSAVAMISVYGAAGFVAAVREWLVIGDLDDVDRAVRVISSGAPQWWSRATGRL